MSQDFDVPEEELRRQAQQAGINRLAVGAAITYYRKLLLVRRVPDTFMGGLYELPGGVAEPNETLDMALRREVREEVGLEVTRITGMIDGFDYCEESGVRVRQFDFVSEVSDTNVRLVPNEHDHFIWVTERSLERLSLSDEIRQAAKSFFVFMSSQAQQ